MDEPIPLAPLQKLAWYNLTVFAGAVGLYVVAVPLLAWLAQKPLAFAALPGLSAFGLCGLWGFGNHFLHDRRRQKKAALDERERAIFQRAMTLGWFLFWEIFVVVCVGGWGYLRYVRGQLTVPVELLPGLVFLGFVVFEVTYSVSILVQYRRDGHHGNV
jgi:hypothetical protein